MSKIEIIKSKKLDILGNDNHNPILGKAKDNIKENKKIGIPRAIIPTNFQDTVFEKI